MANISKEVHDFETAIYGEEVRGSLISLANKINNEVERNTETVHTSVETAKEAVENANNATARANETLGYADKILSDASKQAGNSSDSADLSKSWAVGNTGKRTDEDMDNSRFYSLQSKTEADRAVIAAEKAEQYASFIIPEFSIDFAAGNLTYTDNKDIEFHTNIISGNLEYSYR